MKNDNRDEERIVSQFREVLQTVAPGASCELVSVNQSNETYTFELRIDEGPVKVDFSSDLIDDSISDVGRLAQLKQEIRTSVLARPKRGLKGR